MSVERNTAVDVATDAYDVDGVLPKLTAVPRGTSILVAGPAMTGKTELVADLLGRGLELEEHALVVTPDEGTQRIQSRFPAADGLNVVDCSGTGESFDDSAAVKYVSSPGDLTGIGIGIAKCTQSIGDRASDGVRIAVLSLSTVLRYTDIDALFNFVHVLTGRIEATGYLGVFTIDPTVHDEKTVNTVKAQVDGLVELREADGGGREARVSGFPDVSGEWISR